MTSIQSVIDTIMSQVPEALTADTVDTIKAGDPSQPVTGIVTTFLASQQVLGKAVDLGANLIITHEPTFYNHLDETDWLEDDPVYREKREYVEQHNLVIWRFHDNLHALQPDPTFVGIRDALGWEAYADEAQGIYQFPGISLSKLAQTIKSRLRINMLRMVGDPDMVCQTGAILVGAWGGRNHMNFWRESGVDVLIVGEIDEWETSEYTRDAVIQGRNRGLIITGHANSEEPGMHWLVDWLDSIFPDVPIHHVPVGDPFIFV
jgi:putative NIF3 family GTP cyclohydrolase 1 type 2